MHIALRNGFFRTYLGWFLLTALCIAGCFFSYHYFHKAFPIADLIITMNSHEALAKARELSTRYQWGPEHYQEAASFESDEETKNFIELEGGGTEALKSIIEKHYYCPYFWVVRHFKENQPNETLIYFTPEGKPYGFNQKLAEDMPGAALTAQEAQKIALQKAQIDWQIDPSNYTLVESSQEKKPNGRIDHTFVYEYKHEMIGNTPYRLQLVVSGDSLTELLLSIKIPESFTRRYTHMRSANNLIAFIANILMLILYICCGCIGGFFYLMRHHWLIWRPAFCWGLLLASLQVLNTINTIPLLWMTYDTAFDKTTFFFNIFLTCLLQLLAFTFLLTCIFMIAEGLTRKAFGNHIQLWKLWSKDAGSSLQVAGRTIGGYLVIGFDLAFVTLMYFFASRYLGWWTPSETLYNPNILATYMPWLSSIAQSLNAGFMEECLFRAIPLAGAALIGRYYKKESWFIAIAFIAQAIIFGAAHANYPTQPAYARLIELIIPSAIFGGIYLVFGLLPAILSHFVFDVFWFALPLFISTAAGIWINQVLVIVFSGIPLWVVIYRRIQHGSFDELPQKLYNYAWVAKEVSQPVPTAVQPDAPTVVNVNKAIQPLCIVLGAIGLLGWFFTTHFTQNNLPLSINRTAARDIATAILHEHKIALPPATWESNALIEANLDDQHLFVWRISGKNMYKKLIGTYLAPALWKIRYAQFDGDIVDRAEEYEVYVTGNGLLSHLHHQLPENRPGKELTEQEARNKAYTLVQNVYHVDPKKLIEVSAISSKLDTRLDWAFTFNDPEYHLEQGEARIDVNIAGDEINDYYRYVFIPEQWLRQERQEQLIIKIITMICRLLLALFFVFIIVRNVNNRHFYSFWRKLAFTFFYIFLVKSTIQAYNLWPLLRGAFITSEPYMHQWFITMITVSIQIIIQAIFVGLLAGLTGSYSLYIKQSVQRFRIILGIGLGALLTGLMSALTIITPPLKPLWADYISGSAQWPALSFGLVAITSFVLTTCILLLIIMMVDSITKGWTERLWSGRLLCLSIGILLIGSVQVDSIRELCLMGICFGIFLIFAYSCIIRFDKSIVPIMVATISVLSIIQQGVFNAYPGVIQGAVLASILIVSLAWWWAHQLVADTQNEQLAYH